MQGVDVRIIFLLSLLAGCSTISSEPKDVQMFRDDLSSADAAQCSIKRDKTVCEVNENGEKTFWFCSFGPDNNLQSCVKEED